MTPKEAMLVAPFAIMSVTTGMVLFAGMSPKALMITYPYGIVILGLRHLIFSNKKKRK